MSQHRKTAVITGASSGIGRATAEEFAARGYDIAVLARRKDLLDTLVADLSKRHPEIQTLALGCDISNWEQVEKAFADIVAKFDHVNVLVNNAGAYEYAALERSTPERLCHLIDVNVRGVVFVTKAALPSLKKSHEKKEWAKIVNVSSISGLWGFSNMSTYTATKFAVAGFSGGLERELAPLGIQVGTIYPGPVATKGGPPPKDSKKLIALPPQIAKQIFELATTKRRKKVSHPAFQVLGYLEDFFPSTVDRLLKKMI